MSDVQLKLSEKKNDFFSKVLKFFSTIIFFVFISLLSNFVTYAFYKFENSSVAKKYYTEFVDNNEGLCDESWISKIDTEEIKKKINFIINGTDAMSRYSRKLTNLKYVSYSGRNMLFYGPPGTGKSYLAKTIAKNVSSHYLIVSSGSFQDTYVGSGAKKIRRIFEKAMVISSREKNPVVIIFEEIDSIISEGKITSKDDTLINTFLSYVDKIKDLDFNVIIIGTTNEFNRIEKAAKRSGRFQSIYFGYPSNFEWIEKLINNVKHEIEEKNKFYITDSGLEVELRISPKFWSNLLNILSDHRRYQEERKIILKNEGLTFPLVLNYVEEKIFENILIAEKNLTAELGIFIR